MPSDLVPAYVVIPAKAGVQVCSLIVIEPEPDTHKFTGRSDSCHGKDIRHNSLVVLNVQTGHQALSLSCLESAVSGHSQDGLKLLTTATVTVFKA